MFTPDVIPTERSEWRNLFRDVSTTLDMTGGLYSSWQVDYARHVIYHYQILCGKNKTKMLNSDCVGMHWFWRKGSGAIFRRNCARFNHFGGYLPQYSGKSVLDVDMLQRLAHRLCYFWLFWAQAVMIFHQIEGRSMTSIGEIGTIPYRRWTTFKNNDLYLLQTFISVR